MRWRTLIVISAFLPLGGCVTGDTASPLNWSENCTAILEDRGGRGANVAPAICECIDSAIIEHQGDREDMMQVVYDERAFQQLTRRNRQIVLDCVNETGA